MFSAVSFTIASGGGEEYLNVHEGKKQLNKF